MEQISSNAKPRGNLVNQTHNTKPGRTGSGTWKGTHSVPAVDQMLASQRSCRIRLLLSVLQMMAHSTCSCAQHGAVRRLAFLWSTGLQRLAVPHRADFCIARLWVYCPLWTTPNQASVGCQWSTFHTQTHGPFMNHSPVLIFLLIPTLSLFSKQIWENDQWDVPGGDCAADPDWPDQAGSPLPWADFRASPDQGHLWNQVPVSDRKVIWDQVHLLMWEALTGMCCCQAGVQQTWDLKIKTWRAWLGKGFLSGAALSL